MNRYARKILMLMLAVPITACTQSASLLEDVGLTSASSSHANFRNDLTIRRDLGGSVVYYARKREKIRDDRRTVRFGGRCDSACTLYLGLPSSQTCLLPGATFGFHKPYGGTAVQNRETASYMMNSYPYWVRNWLDSRGGLTASMKVMNHDYAAKFIRRCESAPV